MLCCNTRSLAHRPVAQKQINKQHERIWPTEILSIGVLNKSFPFKVFGMISFFSLMAAFNQVHAQGVLNADKDQSNPTNLT